MQNVIQNVSDDSKCYQNVGGVVTTSFWNTVPKLGFRIQGLELKECYSNVMQNVIQNVSDD